LSYGWNFIDSRYTVYQNLMHVRYVMVIFQMNPSLDSFTVRETMLNQLIGGTIMVTWLPNKDGDITMCRAHDPRPAAITRTRMVTR